MTSDTAGRGADPTRPPGALRVPRTRPLSTLRGPTDGAFASGVRSSEMNPYGSTRPEIALPKGQGFAPNGQRIPCTTGGNYSTVDRDLSWTEHVGPAHLCAAARTCRHTKRPFRRRACRTCRACWSATSAVVAAAMARRHS